MLLTENAFLSGAGLNLTLI